MTVALADQIACVKRELALRERDYPRWVGSGLMKQTEADTELARMRAVLVTLEAIAPEQQGRLL
jgi:hypothetical protein